jgi:hypothetical protein
LKYTGKIVALAFPDTFVKGSTDFICKVLPFLGVGTKQYTKAGHAALLLIENKTGCIRYFDFGRYVTLPGYGRVRSAKTDAELIIDFKAVLDGQGALQNIDKILRWIDAHPEKTHGSGRLLASVCDTIDFKKAETYILNLQARGSIPYTLFEKEGSNCSRLVANTVLEATDTRHIIKRLKFNTLFTPSTVGNVEAASSSGIVYEVIDNEVRQFKGTALKENLTNFFDKKYNSILVPHPKASIPKHLHILQGIGSSAYFEIVSSVLPTYHYRIKRYNNYLDLDFDGVFVSSEFEKSIPYTFTYDSHCKFCHVLQDGKKIKMDCIGTFSGFSSSKRAHLT